MDRNEHLFSRYGDCLWRGKSAAGGCGAAIVRLLWVRRWCASKGHDLYRTADGVKFEKVSTPSLSPMPMQITDIFAVENGLMCLWFATDYSTNTCGSSWGTLFSADNGRNWKQTAMESRLPLAELPTEPSVVNIGGGRLLAIARREKCGGNVQFQLTSTDDGSSATVVECPVQRSTLHQPPATHPLFNPAPTLLHPPRPIRPRGINSRKANPNSTAAMTKAT